MIIISGYRQLRPCHLLHLVEVQQRSVNAVRREGVSERLLLIEVLLNRLSAPLHVYLLYLFVLNI